LTPSNNHPTGFQNLSTRSLAISGGKPVFHSGFKVAHIFFAIDVAKVKQAISN
jgi:hypothetical protein